MQASFILSQAIAIDLATSWLPPLQNTPPITMADLLQAIDFWHINMADLPQTVLQVFDESQVSTQAKISIKNPHIKVGLVPRDQNPWSYHTL